MPVPTSLITPKVEAATAPISRELTKDELIAYASTTASNSGLNAPLFVAVIGCESNWDRNAIGDSGTSYGIAQFHGEEYKEKGLDPIWSINEMASEWKAGRQWRWTCYKILTK